jgi:hypothetical protein
VLVQRRVLALSPKQRSALARKAARTRWRQTERGRVVEANKGAIG